MWPRIRRKGALLPPKLPLLCSGLFYGTIQHPHATHQTAPRCFLGSVLGAGLSSATATALRAFSVPLIMGCACVWPGFYSFFKNNEFFLKREAGRVCRNAPPLMREHVIQFGTAEKITGGVRGITPKEDTRALCLCLIFTAHLQTHHFKFR